MIDVNKQINAVAREVGSKPAEGTDFRVVRLGQTYATGVEDLWDACTNIERIPRWFIPVSGDLSLGGHYQLEGNASGIVEACDPPHLMGLTSHIAGAGAVDPQEVAAWSASAEGIGFMTLSREAWAGRQHRLRHGPGRRHRCRRTDHCRLHHSTGISRRTQPLGSVGC